MLNGSGNWEIKRWSIICIEGVSHRFTWSTKVYVNREGETLALKKWDVGWVVILESCSFHQKAAVRSFRWVCVMLYIAGVAVIVLLPLDFEGILSFIVLPSSNWINFGLSLFFTVKVIDWLKITFNLIFLMRNSVDISPCMEPMLRDAFFSFWKNSRFRQHLVSALQSC